MAADFIPFKSIGLCFSGGGFRATFFSLGVLSYLDKIEFNNKTLLKNVEAISTVSGGTLLGVAYAKAAQEDLDFKLFFKKFYSSFEPKNNILLKTAVAKLENDDVWKEHPYKKRSLINAFALTYADMDIYSGSFQKFENTRSEHLKHVCFNATDFSFGLAFRFQNTGMFGNKPLYSSELKSLKNKVQLGDVVASSSCFPLGFEPLVFPDDYFKDQNSSEYKSLKSLDQFIDGVGIMDGGIADNQGIGSMMRISKQKSSRDRELDLIIVNDVSSFKLEPWQQDTTVVKNNSTLKNNIATMLGYFSVKPMYWITLLVGILIIVLNSFAIIKNQTWPSLYIIGGVISGFGFLLTFFGSMTSIVKMIGLKWLTSLFQNNGPKVLMDQVLTFKKLSVGLIKRMLTERATSTVLMVNDIFSKQIRSLNYKLLYATPSLRNKLITSTVYELNGEKTAYTKKFNHNKDIKPAPSKLLKSVGLTASETPTSLWWDKTDIAKNRMDTLIACGEFTTCYKLMDYILKLKKNALELEIEDMKAIDDLYELLLEDWKAFNKNPFFLVETLKEN